MGSEARPAFSYLACEWVHDLPDEPVLLYSELDLERLETRKVEVFRDGSIGWAYADHEVRSALGEVPVPPMSAIAADPQFRPREISADDFDAIWQRRAQISGELTQFE
jgi:hypothetical protein